jgi:hypothetical protein
MAVLSLTISQFQLESDLIRQKLWPEIHLTGFLTKCLKKDKVDKKNGCHIQQREHTAPAGR